jgi:hypothetical protein
LLQFLPCQLCFYRNYFCLQKEHLFDAANDKSDAAKAVNVLFVNKNNFYKSIADTVGTATTAEEFYCDVDVLKATASTQSSKTTPTTAANIGEIEYLLPNGKAAGNPCVKIEQDKLFEDLVSLGYPGDGQKALSDAIAKIVTSVTTDPGKTLKKLTGDQVIPYLEATAPFMEQDKALKTAKDAFDKAKTEAEKLKAAQDLLQVLTATNTQTGIDATLDTQFQAVVTTNSLDSNTLEKVNSATNYTCKTTGGAAAAACNKALEALYSAFCPNHNTDCQAKASNYIDFINSDTQQTVEGLMTIETPDFATCHKSLVGLDGSFQAPTDCAA